MTYVEIRRHNIEMHAESFDLNHNGFVDWKETNHESQAAIRRVTNDSARNFAFLTVGIFSFVLSVIYLLFDSIITFLKVKNQKELKNT
ncbi:hypothetical protein [Flagellimonas crocea]|uniref:hypothetical protein n=1 Tax=Flagellimonas crocea TaxID=3067311 RepID=UPI00296EC2C1|nr:hypothetical protein [Muricauda sp. DH64]